LGYLVYWVWEVLYIFSVGEQTTNPVDANTHKLAQAAGNQFWQQQQNYQSFQWNALGYRYAFAAVLVHLLWTVEFIIYFTYLVVSGAVANWYFSYRQPNSNKKVRGFGENELPHFPVFSSLKRTLMFHMGTAAFAALIIGIVDTMRTIVRYVETKIEAQGKEPNKLQKCIMSTLGCCVDCADCCLDKISTNALVWTSIWGDSFLVACCSSFELIWRNLSKVAAITLTQGFLVILGKAMVSLAATGASTMLIHHFYGDQISSIIMPAVVLFVLSFMVATLFMSVFQTTIDCIFFCYLVDSSANEGTPDRMYASKELHEIFLKTRPASEEKAQKIMAAQDERVRQRNAADQPAAPAPAPVPMS